uniref:Putative chromatin remodeling complex wstf-iswi small subunit n=1 Tax=Corethrella appendiculata TaxID=1370023 RepID=W4VRR5_9DIPT
MTSRLDRLFILLESGSAAVTRKAAAKQIGEVQRLHPHELHNLLNRLLSYLHSSNWDTRIAASQAVQAILENVPQWNPLPSSGGSTTATIKIENNKSELLTFENFDLAKVLTKGARLMGSEGTEFDLQDESNDDNSLHEKLIKQRALINEKLGFNSGININDLVTLDDVKQTNSAKQQAMLPVQEILKLDSIVDDQGNQLSSREKNARARRLKKARQNQCSSSSSSSSSGVGSIPSTSSGSMLSRSNSVSNELDEPDRKKIKVENVTTFSEPVPDSLGCWIDAIDWPLDSFCSKLYLDLFSARWETRHGSATALRELLKSHCEGGGKSINMTKEEMFNNHSAWLDDAALRLICVLALDRFGDFVSDQVIAPVRETCAQVLGTILKKMSIEKVHKIVDILLTFSKQDDWEVRHGGLLGLKYMIVVREDLIQTILPLIINEILTGLFDSVDDVGAVAASTLIPIASWLPKLLNSEQVSHIVKLLWDLLLEQDELASACNSFMGLLAAILSLPNASTWIQMEPMSILIPRLWPFLSHCTSSVRRSTLHTLKTLTNADTTNKNNSNGNAASSSSLQSSLPMNGENNKDEKLVFNFGVKDWPAQLLQDSLRHIYQRVLVENYEDIQDLAEQVWINLVKNAELSALLHASCPYVASWLCLAMQPARLAFDPDSLIFPKPHPPNNCKDLKRHRQLDSFEASSASQPKLFLGGAETVPQDVREKNIFKARTKACRMIGLLSKYLVLPAPGIVYTPGTESPIDCYCKVLIGYLQSRSALQRLISSLVIAFWAGEYDQTIAPGPIQLQEKLKSCLNEYIYYDEVALLFTRLHQESRDFIATLKQYKVPITEFDNYKILTLEQINQLCTQMTENLRARYQLKPKIADKLEERRKSLQSAHLNTSNEQTVLNISTQSCLAGAMVSLKCLPEKLNPIVKPLMESIKREECEILQKLSAKFLSNLLDQITMREPCPNNKIILNLCTLLKCDPDFTPKIIIPEKNISFYSPNDVDITNPYHGILTLLNQQKTSDGQSNGLPRGPGRPPTTTEVVVLDDLNQDKEDSIRKSLRIQRIGAKYAITTMCSYFENNLPEKIPMLWTLIIDKIANKIDSNYVDLAYQQINQDELNELMTSLQLIEITIPHIDEKLFNELFKLAPKLCLLLKYPLKSIRHMTSRCLATLSSVNPSFVMTMVINEILPLLSSIENVIYRQGSAEAISLIVTKLQIKIVPFVVLLIVPLLGRMSDPDQSVRLISTHCFATLIQLMPLDCVATDSINDDQLNDDLRTRKLKDKKFLEYLFTPKKIPNFKIPIKINADLRPYQQAGVNWLYFLNQFKLHGILCDDMGLGKTLQAICILAGDHYNRINDSRCAQLPSIVICPPTLTGHWVYEIEKFVPKNFLQPLHYVGMLADRERLRHKLNSHNLIVASYDIIRKDIEFFSTIQWNYCILDEGHIIKNGKTKSSKAIKQLIANHRLILSGTPIQNNVLELWSLFDFLMPGFLGTEKQFNQRFSRPILASRDAKSSAKEQEAGALALEALHRQVLPFLLRRVKEDVLKDLPPKITQDLLCELSPLQERLYEDFSRLHLNSDLRECLENIDEKQITNKKTHVFQALRYLQNVCNHPKLVLTPQHPEYNTIINEISNSNLSLDDIENSAKLPALKQLLLDCGIGTNEDVSVNQHRALIFCQLKAMLDIIENDLLKKHLPAVSYLRLDGSIPAGLRHQIVTNFNSDPSIDVLLLTTQVGGLGLNLTGADVVIFVEHDWNPMKDLQAMDRAHRIGQKKVVNVYRLITRKSLEEKIMGLQKFKLLTANTIVSDENSSMETMGTDQLLDLFNLNMTENNLNGSTITATSDGNKRKDSESKSVKTVLENLPELWDDNQYVEEYDLSQFLQGLKKN